MLQRSKFRIVLVILLACFLVGCIKVKMNVLVYPDSSGKILITLGLRNDVYNLKFGNKGQMWTLDDFDNTKGINAWLRPKEYKQGNFRYVELTGYFTDINDVKFKDGNPSFVFSENDDGGSTLKFIAFLKGDEKVDDDKITRDLLKDVEILYAFKLPGKVEKVKKWQTQGRDASWLLDVDDIINVQEKKDGILEAEFISGKPAQAVTKETEQFKKEFEKAKKEWEKYRKELEEQEE